MQTFVPYVSISKSVLISLRVIRLYDIKNTLSFPSEETSFGSGLSSHLPLGDVPCPHGALLTVFSTTQLGHSITQCDLCYQSFGDALKSPIKNIQAIADMFFRMGIGHIVVSIPSENKSRC